MSPALLLCTQVLALSVRSEFSLGADYNDQQYAAVRLDTIDPEADTIDRDTEGRLGWRLALGLDSGRARFDAGSNLNLSTRSVRELLTLDWERELTDRLTLQTGYAGEIRFYHDAFPILGDTGLSRDYLSQLGQVRVKFRPSQILDFSLTGAVEHLHYPKPDSYAFDYVLGRVRAGASLGLGGDGMADAEYGWTRRRAFSNDSQDYEQHALDVGFDDYFDGNWQIRLGNVLNRRRYPVRYRSYWEEGPRLEIGYDPSTRVGLTFSGEPTLVLHDSTTETYRNQLETELRLNLELRPDDALAFKFGPQWQSSRSLPGTDPEDYREAALGVGVEYLRAGRVWFSAEDRLGVRRYIGADSSYQSNYLFNQFDLFLNWTIVPTKRGGLNLNAMVSIAPERHAEQTDDYTTSSYSLELKYGF